MSLEFNVWGIHTQDDTLFRSKTNSVVAIGWKPIGDISIFTDRDQIKHHYSEVFPNASKSSIATSSGMLYRFVYEIKIGDYIVYPSKNDRMINIGMIESPYFHDDSEMEYSNKRKVRWLKKVPRAYFSQGALYEVGSALSLFLVKNYSDEFLATISLNKINIDDAEDEDDTIEENAAIISENTKDFVIKELSKHLKGYAFEEYVADLLNAMGYQTKLSPKGGDSGIDIIAYKSELPPRILVQVKSQDSNITESTIQSLKGAMSEGDYGLFVTLSDFTKNANLYLMRHPIIKGMNGIELVELTLKYYDVLSEKHKKYVPLKKVFIPDVEMN